MKKQILFLGLLILGVSACEKTIDIEVPFEDPKLVLNGFLNPDSSITVHLSKSQFILDEAELKNITDARVSVYEGEQLLGELEHRQYGIYQLKGVIPQPGKIYTIQAEREGFPTVSAKQELLSLVEPENLQIKSQLKEENGEVAMKIEFEIKDVTGKDNIYLVKVFEKRMQTFYDSLGRTLEYPVFYPLPMESPDPLLEEFCPEYYGCGLILLDDYLEGKSYRVKLDATAYHYGEEEVIEYFLGLYHVPESFYRFYKTLEVNRDAGDNPFAEPAKVFSNVEGGYGIWSSVSPVFVKLNP